MPARVDGSPARRSSYTWKEWACICQSSSYKTIDRTERPWGPCWGMVRWCQVSLALLWSSANHHLSTPCKTLGTSNKRIPTLLSWQRRKIRVRLGLPLPLNPLGNGSDFSGPRHWYCRVTRCLIVLEPHAGTDSMALHPRAGASGLMTAVLLDSVGLHNYHLIEARWYPKPSPCTFTN
jgi:hypothetical protein